MDARSYHKVMNPVRSSVVQTVSPNHVLPRYWLCILLHGLVVLVRTIMLIISVTGVDRSIISFNIAHLSLFNSLMNFTTSIFGAAMIWLTIWALQPLAIHNAFARPQTLTALHDQTLAWLGPGASLTTVWRNGTRQPASLFVILVYFIASWGLSSSFVPSFTFESYQKPVTSTVTLNSITTAMTKAINSQYLVQTQEDTVYLLSSYATFRSLNFSLPGLGYGTIYDTLANLTRPEFQITVPAIALSVTCGDVPQSNWTTNITLISDGVRLSVNTTVNQRALGVSGDLSAMGISNLTSNQLALYKGFEDSDPSAPASRNLYFLGFSTDPSYFVADSNNSTGDFLSLSFGVTTAYVKVIGCSLTTSNTTIIIDGQNHPVNNTDRLPPPDPHLWFNATPLPSRGLPYEDLFNALYLGPAAIKVERGADPGELQLSLFEEALVNSVNSIRTLQHFETSVRLSTSFSYGALGAILKYSDIAQPLRAAGWDPKPTTAVATISVLYARLRLSWHFAIIGLAASVIFFAAALMIIGCRPVNMEKVIGNPGLLQILSMLRHSSLPAALNDSVGDQSVVDDDMLRQFGAEVKVYVSVYGQLDVAQETEMMVEK